MDSKKIRAALEGILSKKVDSKTNQFLFDVINYDKDKKFASINVLIDMLPQDIDGTNCKKVLNMIVNYLKQPDVDAILITSIKEDANKNLVIRDLIEMTIDDITEEQRVITMYNDSKFRMAGLDLTEFLEYNVDTKTIIEHIYEVGVETTNVFGK